MKLRISTFLVYVFLACVCVCFVFLTPLISLTIQFQICVLCCISGLILVCLKCLQLCVFHVLYVFLCVFGCYTVRSIVVFRFVFLLCPCCRSSLCVSFTVLHVCAVFFYYFLGCSRGCILVELLCIPCHLFFFLICLCICSFFCFVCSCCCLHLLFISSLCILVVCSSFSVLLFCISSGLVILHGVVLV